MNYINSLDLLLTSRAHGSSPVKTEDHDFGSYTFSMQTPFSHPVFLKVLYFGCPCPLKCLFKEGC